MDPFETYIHSRCYSLLCVLHVVIFAKLAINMLYICYLTPDKNSVLFHNYIYIIIAVRSQDYTDLFCYHKCFLTTQCVIYRHFIKKYDIELRDLSVSVNFCSIIKLT